MIKKTIIYLLLIVNIAGCAGMEKWRPVDRALFAGYTAGNIVDILQTREIMRDGNGFHEINGFLDGMSRDQVTGFMIGTNVGLYFLVDALPKFRTPLLGVANAYKWGFVIHNNRIGVRAAW